MEVKVKYLGMVSDALGLNSENVTFEKTISISDFVSNLKQKYTNLNNLKFRVAINQKLLSEDTLISNGDELALLPPFAGG